MTTLQRIARDRHALAIQAAIGWCIGGLGPVLVLGARDLDVPRYQLAWLGSAFGFGLLGAGFLGRRILSHGAEPVTRIGAVVVTTGVLLLGFGTTVPLLIAGGLLQGIGCAAFLIATPALIGIEHRARRLAMAVGVSSIAGLVAPAVIALSDQLFATGRVGLIVPALWLLIVAVRRVRASEGLGIDRPVAAKPTTAETMTANAWRRWSVIVLAVSAEFCFWTWGAARLVDSGVEVDTASGLAASFAIGMAVGRLIGPRSVGRLDPVALGALVCGIAALVVIPDVSAPVLVVGMTIAGLGIAVLYPVSLARLLDVPTLPEPRLIALAAFASGVAITVTPTVLGVLDRVIEIRYAFALVPVFLAGAVVLDRRSARST
jgi:MFS family permease